MATPAHVETFISIVAGLALTDVAHSLHRLLRAGRKVRWNLLAPLAAVLVTISVVHQVFITETVVAQAVSFTAFLPNLVSLMLLFLLASATLPDEVPADGLSLETYYLANRTYFWGLFALWLLALVFNEALTLGARGQSAAQILEAVWRNLLFLPIFGLLMWTRSRWVHGAILVFCLVAVVGSWIADDLSPAAALSGSG